MAGDKTEIGAEVGNEQPVTSQPASAASAAASAAAARGDCRASSVMQMMKILRETRQQVSEMRQKTESALAYIQQVNAERREQLDDIQSTKAQLNLLHSQLAKIVSYHSDNKQLTSAEQLLPGKSEASA